MLVAFLVQFGLPALRNWFRSRREHRSTEAQAEGAFRDDLLAAYRREQRSREAAEERARGLDGQMLALGHQLNNAKYLIKLLVDLLRRHGVEPDIASPLIPPRPVPIVPVPPLPPLPEP